MEEYLGYRGIIEEDMQRADREVQSNIDAYNLRAARKASHLAQVDIMKAMGVSQNRVSRMENGDIGVMDVDGVHRYVEAVGGKLKLIAELPTGTIRLAG